MRGVIHNLSLQRWTDQEITDYLHQKGTNIARTTVNSIKNQIEKLQFLSQVDISKGKIKVKITRMYRLKAIDYSTENEESKEYLYWESNWYAKNYLGAEISPVVGHIEGKYKEQTKKLVSGMDPTTARMTADYIKDIPREMYCIPFSKTEVDKVLKGEHPFGPDSVNITDLSKVIFYGKFDGMLGIMNFRCADFTYEPIPSAEHALITNVNTLGLNT